MIHENEAICQASFSFRCTLMANLTSSAPQWGTNTSQERVCAICLRGDGPSLISPCGQWCDFQIHRRCFDRWKGSSSTGTCPICEARLVRKPDLEISFSMGDRVILGSGPGAPLVTVVGVKYISDKVPLEREYAVVTSCGVVSEAMPSTLSHVPMCRCCGSGRKTLEFNPCDCRGSLLQFAHSTCLLPGTRCIICAKVMNGSAVRGQRQPSTTWDRIRGVLGFSD